MQGKNCSIFQKENYVEINVKNISLCCVNASSFSKEKCYGSCL